MEIDVDYGVVPYFVLVLYNHDWPIYNCIDYVQKFGAGMLMSTLSEIMPKKHARVIDLVSAAGVNVDDWENVQGGPHKAAANPKYCYEWAFVQPKKVVVLNLWYEALVERNGKIVRDLNMRESAKEFGQLPYKAIWGLRALRMDKAIQKAINSKLPIRVILCSGQRRGIDQPKTIASKVKKRLLDLVPWTVTAYDWNTGQCTLTRGN